MPPPLPQRFFTLAQFVFLEKTAVGHGGGDGRGHLFVGEQGPFPDWATYIDANGYLPAQHWPRVYNVIADNSRNDVKVV